MASSNQAGVVTMRAIASNASWNMLGRIGPIAIALLVTPHLIQGLGLERWGMFTIALSLIGTFGIFDFGLGRAITRLIAEKQAEGEVEESAGSAAAGIIALGGLGVACALIAGGAVWFWVGHGLKIPVSMRHEMVYAMWVLCATAPLVLINAAMWGVLSAFQKFRAANLINLPISVMYYLGPLLILQVWNSMIGVMLTLAACRITMTIAYGILCVRAMPELLHAKPTMARLRPLLRVGGWMTLSNLLFPLVSYMDRFMIASILSAAMTAYYTTPFDLVTRLSMITIAVTNTAYPAMAGAWRRDPEATSNIYRRCALSIAALLFPASVIFSVFSNDIISLWLNPEFAAHSQFIMKCLATGTLLFGIDSVASSLIDGIGRPDVNAKLSLAEVLLYGPLLLVFLHFRGVDGAAIAWEIRSVLDCLVRMGLGARLYPALNPAIRRLMPVVLVALVVSIGGFLVNGFVMKCVVALAMIAIFYVAAWSFGLTETERTAFFQIDRLRLRKRVET